MLALLACLAMTANPSAAAFSSLLAQNRNQLCSLQGVGSLERRECYQHEWYVLWIPIKAVVGFLE
jgi:hypothetical protein